MNYLICEGEVKKMQLCRECCIPMVGVMSFSRDKREKFYQCPKCHGETKHNFLRDDEIDFREVLHKEINRCRRNK